ncbi:MAG TPA: hypothetical protein DEP66_01705 [Acidimicrobiaceae bacterium]|nr:hypothetical protein [Acidimicrobiaceae bacterium]HCB36954.1 hypothetical protein [Acidimicrobiaceae bacterium]
MNLLQALLFTPLDPVALIPHVLVVLTAGTASLCVRRQHTLLRRGADGLTDTFNTTIERTVGHHDERGEGVISAAIAVLIIASLGALMWVGFKSLWENAESTTNSEIAKIGQ